MEKSEAKELVMMLFAAFPSAKGDAESWRRTLSVYGEMLADLERDAARRAVTRLIGTAKWLPTVAEIRAAATELVLGPVRTGVEAYDELMQRVRTYGRCYGGEPAPEFADPLIPRALGVWGSWNDLCSSPSDDPGGRARFIELYDELAQRKRQDVTSGIPLPAPKSSPQLSPAARPRPALAPAAALPPVLTAAPRKPPAPSPYHRRVSAEELEALVHGKASGGAP